MSLDSLRPSGALTNKNASLFAKAEKETSENYISQDLTSDTGIVTNLERVETGLITARGWATLAKCSGMAVKVFLWGCVNAVDAGGGRWRFILGVHQRKVLAKGADCHEQSVINAVAELIKAGIIRREAPGKLLINRTYGGHGQL